ncbi:ANTAR domain-containing protein [Streptomyces californicus]|uniref:ANTAR domain-containing protein n=1 Tax=Streptomyces californicus TaxID=67351 RepID=UPI0037ACD625
MSAARTHTQREQTLATRHQMGQAMGILMDRHNIAENHACNTLRRYAQDHSVKLRDVALLVCEQGAQLWSWPRGPGPGPQQRTGPPAVVPHPGAPGRGRPPWGSAAVATCTAGFPGALPIDALLWALPVRGGRAGGQKALWMCGTGPGLLGRVSVFWGPVWLCSWFQPRIRSAFLPRGDEVRRAGLLRPACPSPPGCRGRPWRALL